MTAVETHKPRTYGDWDIPRAFGWGGFGLIASLTLAVGVSLTIAAFTFFGLITALVILAVTVSATALMSYRDKHGMTLIQRLAERRGYRRAARGKTTSYRSGPLSGVPHGDNRLPGVAAQTRLIQHNDTGGHPFALIETPLVNDHAIVLMGEPDGDALNDPATIDQMVSNYGGWLAGLGEEEGIQGAAVIIETRPDSGQRLRAEVDAHGGNGSPAARNVMNHLATNLHVGGAITRAWATVTFNGSSGGRRRTAREVAVDLAARVPVIADGLSATGAGAIRAATAADVAEAVRTAYDPASASLFDEARAAGETIELPWSQVGPIADDETFDWYHHDGVWSKTWMMTRPPKGVVQSRVLARLLAPHPAIAVKRVALLYLPWDLGDAADVVERDQTNAESAVNNPAKARATRADVNRALKAERVADAQAQGAGLVDFALLVTATITNADRKREADAVISGLTRGARLLTRPAYGGPRTAFAFGLPLGLIPAHHAPFAAKYRGKI